MDWIGQLDVLTKLLVLIFVVLVCVAGFLWLALHEADLDMNSMRLELSSTKSELAAVIAERNALSADIDELVAAVDAQDRSSGAPWGPAREKIEDLRRRKRGAWTI